MTIANKLYERISTCDSCSKIPEVIGRPFAFKAKNQKIMLISASPSLQAAFKPITSVRFFREVSSFLFAQNIDETIIKCFDENNIYWTHYHKCCYKGDNYIHRLEKLRSKCSDKFLKDEIELLQNNLELIIVMGKPIHNKVRRYLKNLEGIKIEYIKFPENESNKKREEIRELITKVIGEDQNHIYNKNIVAKEKHSNKYIHSIHLDFEIRALQKNAIELSIPVKDYSVINDDTWIDNVVIPIKKKQMFFFECHQFIESQIKTFLLSRMGERIVIEAAKDVYKFREGELFDNNIKRNTLSVIETYWINLFKDYQWKLNKDFGQIYLSTTEATEIWYEKANEMRQLRNIIVHDSGFVNFHNRADRTYFKSIYDFGNLLFIDNRACEDAYLFVKETVEVIKSVEKMKKNFR